MDEMNEAVEKGLEYWYQRQKQYLTEFWRRSDLDIDGDEETAVAVRYNLYQLLQSAGRDEFCNIAAKGLSGEGYEGHYFWDTEMYMQPFFTLTNPDISRKLLSFRYRTLDEARKNAALRRLVSYVVDFAPSPGMKAARYIHGELLWERSVLVIFHPELPRIISMGTLPMRWRRITW